MDIKIYTPRAVIKEQSIFSKVKSQTPLEGHINSTKSMIIDLTYMGQKKRKSSKGSDITLKLTSECVLLKDQNTKMQ